MRILRRLGRAALGLLLLLAILLALGFRRDRPAAEVEARHVTAASRFVDVDGLRVHYRDRGQGPVLVLLHGSNSSLHTWEGWVAQLGDRRRVITLDLPGHGLTGPDAKERYSPAQMADVVDGLMRALGVARFALGGNSMGGNVAWHYALQHPDKVERLILVDAVGYPRREPRPLGLRLVGAPFFGRLARWVTPRFAVSASVRDAYGDRSRVSDALVDDYYDLMLRDGNREAARIRLGLPMDDGLSARIKTLRVPTLILWGARDRWVLPHYAEQFHADIAGSQLHVLDGLGHAPMEEAPAPTAAVVARFLEDQRP